MSQIATSIEQSKRLLAAGIDPKSCDMRWTNIVKEEDDWGFVITRQEEDYHLELGQPFFVFPYDPSIPAWSLSRLWTLIGKTKVYEFHTDMDDLIEVIVNILCNENPL